jgi:glycerophosphoryl diester phosphodiesterase
MDVNSDIGGASMVVAPTGEVLCNMYSRVGIETVDVDIKKKYYKPAGFGNPLAAHYEYIEKGRRPWKYRPGGSAIARYDQIMPYPRVCAHRGFNTVAPENSLPAFGAAIAMGAQEIEFDLWYTTDGVVVSSHDSKLERVSDGTGRIYEHSYEELLTYDFGFKFGEKFKGLKILTLEEILKKFSCHCVMNIHIKTTDNKHPADEDFLKKIIALVRKYDCEKYVYFMSGTDSVLEQLMNLAPDLARCCGGGDAPYEMVERALKYGCKKIQLVKGKFTEDMIARAHEHGIACNIFWSDDPEETESFLNMGIDTVLTNDYGLISQVVNAREKYVYY